MADVAAELTRLADRPSHAQVVARLKAYDRTAAPTSDEIRQAVAESRW